MAVDSFQVKETVECDHYEEDVVILDVETTGKQPAIDRIIQIALIKVLKNGQVETFNELFNPCLPRKNQLDAYKFHKISPDLLLSKSKFPAFVAEISDFIGETKYLAGHNVWFDWNFLLNEFKRAGDYWLQILNKKHLILLDTYKLSIRAYPKLTTYKLQSLAEYLKIMVKCEPTVVYKVSSPKKKKSNKICICNKTQSCYHDAMGDALITKELLLLVTQELLHKNSNLQPLSLKVLEQTYPFSATGVDILTLLDKFEGKKLDDFEMKLLINNAAEFISTLKGSRGKVLKDIPLSLLTSEIKFLEKSIDINDKRKVKLYNLILHENSLDSQDKEQTETVE